MPSKDHGSLGVATSHHQSISTYHPTLSQAIASASVASEQFRLEHSNSVVNSVFGSYPVTGAAGKFSYSVGKQGGRFGDAVSRLHACIE